MRLLLALAVVFLGPLGSQWCSTQDRVIEGPVGDICCLEFSPDNSTVVFGTSHGHVKIWSLTDDKQRLAFKAHELAVSRVSMSPDGKTAASGGFDKTVRLFDAASGKETRTPMNVGGQVVALCFSPDGHMLAVGSMRESVEDNAGGFQLHRDGRVRVIDLQTNKERLSEGGYDSYALAFSPDGRNLAVGLRLFELATGKVRAKLTRKSGPIHSLAFLDGGRTLLRLTVPGSLRTWDLFSDNDSPALEHPIDGVLAAMTNNGKLVALCSKYGVVKVIDVVRSNELLVTDKCGPVRAMAFSPDGSRLGVADATRVLIWDMDKLANRPPK